MANRELHGVGDLQLQSFHTSIRTNQGVAGLTPEFESNQFSVLRVLSIATSGRYFNFLESCIPERQFLWF